MRKLTDLPKIVCHTGHYFSCFVIIVELIRQLLKVIEHITSHLRLHSYTYCVSLILNKVVKEHSYKVQNKKHRAEYHDKLELLIRNEIVQHISCDYRIKNRNNRHQKRRKHIENKQRPVYCDDHP